MKKKTAMQKLDAKTRNSYENHLIQARAYFKGDWETVKAPIKLL